MNGDRPMRWDLMQKRSLAVGLIAGVLCAGGALIFPPSFFRAYLSAYIFWVGIPVGCLALLMLHHLVGGRWGFMIQRVLEAAIQTLPLMALLFIPLFFGLSDLYPWARTEVVAADPLLQQKAAYLNIPFFIARAVFYFAVWIVLGRLLVTWSLQQDRTADDTLTLRLQRLSGPGLVLYGLTVSFAAIDWMMSLEPKWYSTIFGMMFMVSFGLAALALAILATRFLETEKPLAQRGIAGPLARSRQSLARLGDVLGVPEFFSVFADLVGKSDRRDPVVFTPHRRRVGVACHRVDTLSVWTAFRFAAVAYYQTQLSDTGDSRRGDPFHALAGHDLDDRAVFLSGGISPPLAGYRGAGGHRRSLARRIYRLSRSTLVAAPA